MRRLCALACALALLCGGFALGEAAEYRTLSIGDRGADVLALKTRLRKLGFYKASASINEYYNELCADKVKEYQRFQELEETGVATPELQALLFSEAGAFSPDLDARAEPVLPALTADGFLPEGEYVYQSADQWVYLSPTLRVVINRYQTEGTTPMTWFETEVRHTEAESLRRYETTVPKGRVIKTEHPATLAVENNLVLAVNDDFYAMRVRNGDDAGTIIVDGEIRYSKKRRTLSTELPSFDVFALFADGSAKAYYSTEYTADELLAMGAVQTFAFGPVVLTGGETGTQIAAGNYSHREPRTVIGYLEPRHYLLLTVEGRQSTASGASLQWVADRLKALGVTEALNLDGGNTVSLVFLGELLNSSGTYSNGDAKVNRVRSISSMLGIGQSKTPLSTGEAAQSD